MELANICKGFTQQLKTIENEAKRPNFDAAEGLKKTKEIIANIFTERNKFEHLDQLDNMAVNKNLSRARTLVKKLQSLNAISHLKQDRSKPNKP